jgi:FlaA1/EpsC-like NDP-sugar epimerase
MTLFRISRVIFILLLQMGIVAGAFYLAFLLRFDFAIPATYKIIFFDLLPPLFILKVLIFSRSGLFQGWWRYVSLADAVDILKANILASLGFVLYIVFFYGMAGIPRSVLFLDGFLSFLLACGMRVVTRAFRENYLPMPRFRKKELAPVVIVGAGQAGQAIAREIRQNTSLGKKVIGYIDDDRMKWNRRFQGIPVLGGQETLGIICQAEGVQDVIIAIPSASGKDLRRIVNRCEGIGIRFKTLPGMGDLISGSISLQNIRDIQLDDLLGRQPVRLEVDEVQAFIEGRRVLVTGAGGSIGSEICRQVGRFNPSLLILYDNAETPLFYIENEMLEKNPGFALKAIVGDICNRARVENLFDDLKPQVVFHAAAFKHVPMMERNPAEAVNNNVRGTKIVADAAHRSKAESFVMISTDKAVNPCNVMGASKRIAEIYVQSLSRRSPTRFVTVRFGNVLSSAGSVVPIFQEQIRKGGPVRVTHPEVTRYFMTKSEAVQLVLQAASMGEGGEIFLLDMGEPIKILHLAEEMIRLSGLLPQKDIEIVFIGLRPGERLHEELLVSGEDAQPTKHEKIKIARAISGNWRPLADDLEELYHTSREVDQGLVSLKMYQMIEKYHQNGADIISGNREGICSL